MRLTTVTRHLTAFMVLAAAALSAPPWLLAQSPFGATDARGGRTLDATLPNEAVDPFSGTLSIVETDLVLPGNAGLDVRVQRVYSSAIYPGYDDDDLTIEEDSWAGIGWKLHFGRVINPDATTGGATQIEMGDGSRHALYTTSVSPGWTTKGFWLYDRGTHHLKLPNGLVYEFGHVVNLGGTLGTVRYVTVIRDPFNNRIEFQYFVGGGPVDGVLQIRQYLGAGQVREINFGYNPVNNSLLYMYYDGRQWNYEQQAAGPSGFSTLERALSPVGLATEYDYSTPGPGQPGHELTVLRAPGGGSITYTYVDVLQQASSVTNKGRGVSTKALAGPHVTAGTWTYHYGTGPNLDTTRVECPCGTTTYRFNGIGTSGNFSGWLAGTLAEQTTEQQGSVLERTQFIWQQSEAISPDPTAGQGGIWSDPGVFAPLLAIRTVTRGTTSWTTTHEYRTGLGNFNDYGRAWRTAEDGELDRLTTRTFQYGFTPYIVDRVAKEEVGPLGYERNWDYDLATGFLTAQAIGAFLPNGPTYTFQPTTQGNVAAAIDPLGNPTTFWYSWGRVSRVATPGVVTDYIIAPDGTVTAEETGPLVTSYGYDLAFRLTVVRPPGNTTLITYEYDNIAAGFLIERRLPEALDYRFDGFGRVRSTVDHVGVKTRVERDACGRTTFQSHPYTAGAGTAGIATAYDALSRPVTVTEGTALTQYAYPGANLVVTDPKNRVTHYEYSAFGSPEDRRLTLLRDADQKFTRYGYDVFGNVTTVNGPNASGLTGSTPARTWVRDARGVVLHDTQPESGTTTYVHDSAGNLKRITDFAGGITDLHYDGNNRLWKRDAPGTGDDLEIAYGAAGQVEQMASPTLASPVTRTTLTYDPAGRVSSRADLINGHTFTSQYAYLSNDALDQITYPSHATIRPVGRTIKYDYVQGRLSAVRNNGAIFADLFTYSDAGALASYRTGTVTHTIGYDARQRVQTMTSGTLPTGLSLTYGYDDANQVAQIQDPRPGMSQTFEYDAVGRVWAADGPWGALRWSYDPAGNRLTETRGSLTNYHYDPPTQRLMSTSGGVAETFTYDALGRLETDSRGTYTYNARSLLATVTKTGLSASYSYDAAGLRSLRTVNGHTTYTVRGVGGDVLSEFASPCGAPVWARDVVYAGGRLLGAVRANLAPPTVAVTAATAMVAESQASVQVGVQLTTPGGTPTSCPVTVAYETTANTATVGADYVGTGGTLTFPAGTVSGTVLYATVSLVQDTANEPLERFTLLLSGATGAAIVAPAGQTVTIDDDDLAPAMSVDGPLAGIVRTPFEVWGWAIDEAMPTGTGVSTVHIYATPTGGSAAFVGSATYGIARPDVAAAYNHTRFTNAGFSLMVHLPPGGYTISAHAQSTDGLWKQSQAVVVTVAAANPQMSLDAPATPGATLAQPFAMSGWAIDLGTGAGTGVDRVEILAYPNPGSGTPPVNLGDATYGGSRPDVQQAHAAYGSGFTNSGFQKDVRGLTPGVYKLVAQARSTVTGTFNQLREITVTVTANPVMWVDPPAPGASVTQSFLIAGWAVDVAAASGTGVNGVHIYAYPNPGSGTPPIFLGVATYGAARPDIAALYGSQFLNSGFNLTASLAPGPYLLAAHAFSTVTNTFNQVHSVTVTVATSQPVITIDHPANASTVPQPFWITGWAIDLGSPSGPGVDAVHIYAIANGGTGAATFLGAAGYGGARTDVAQVYGDAKFTNCGYGLSVSGLAPGYYQINVHAHSTVSGGWPYQTFFVTVQ